MMDESKAIAEHLLQSSPDAVIVVDDRGRIRFANETVRELLGHDPDALLGRPLDDLIPERLRERHGQHTAGFLRVPRKREMGAQAAELIALRADGTELAADIRLTPLRIDGKLYVAAAIRDNSERRQTSEKLAAARDAAERANRAKSRFLAMASHDLRQPMQTLRLLNAAMLKMGSPRGVQELVQHQGHAIERMTQLLNALLDISRLESGAIAPLLTDVRLTDVFAELRAEFEPVAEAKGIRLRIDAPALVVSTDRVLFCQIFQNLLGNALKYTERGSVSLSGAFEEDALAITVADTGVGIPADKLERIFDEYFQVDARGVQRTGVGLGLAIVKEIAPLLGLAVRIASEVGAGTQARVCVPGSLVLTPAPGALRKPRVILVDDNDGVRMATEMFLKIQGHETVSARSVSEAEQLMGSVRVGDVVIADYHLDGPCTGLDLLVRLRERIDEEVPGIILSGDLATVVRSIKAPIPRCRFLGKPVDTGALIEAIHELSVPAAESARA